MQRITLIFAFEADRMPDADHAIYINNQDEFDLFIFSYGVGTSKST
jgi:hypothetical protein